MLCSPAKSGEHDQNIISNTEPSAKLLFCSQEVRTTARWCGGKTDAWKERWLGLCLGLFLPLGQARKHSQKSSVKKERITKKHRNSRQKNGEWQREGSETFKSNTTEMEALTLVSSNLSSKNVNLSYF